MIDLPNKIEDNLESRKLDNLKSTSDIKQTPEMINFTDNSINSSENVLHYANPDLINAEANTSTTNVSSTSEDTDTNVVNCLALTVKKDYSLSIVKNVVVKTLKNFWRVAVSIFTLNLLKFFM